MITPLNGCKAVELSKIAIDMDSTMLSFLGSAINPDTGLSIIHRHQLKKVWHLGMVTLTGHHVE